MVILNFHPVSIEDRLKKVFLIYYCLFSWCHADLYATFVTFS